MDKNRACRPHEGAWRGEAGRRVLGEGAGNHAVDRRGEAGPPLGHGRRVRVDVGPEGGLVGVPRIGWGTRQEVHEDTAEGVHVGAGRQARVRGGCGRLGGELLGRHVGGSPHRAERQRGLASRGRPLREPEIGEVGGAPRVEADVRGRHVAVDDPAGVGHVEGVRDGRQQVESRRRGEGTAGPHDFGQVGPVQVAHREVELAVALARGVDGDDVRMLQGGEGVDLAKEALAVRGIRRQCRGDQLEGDTTPGPLLGREVDDAHPAPGEDGVEVVAGEDAAGGERSDHAASCDPRSGPPGEYRTARKWGPASPVSPARSVRPRAARRS